LRLTRTGLWDPLAAFARRSGDASSGRRVLPGHGWLWTTATWGSWGRTTAGVCRRRRGVEQPVQTRHAFAL